MVCEGRLGGLRNGGISGYNPDDTRSGRWEGQEKTECGIHIDSDGKIHRTSRSE